MSEQEDLWDILQDLLPDDWGMEGNGPYDFNLVCPHGEYVEMDGWCPAGCTSPFRKMGMI